MIRAFKELGLKKLSGFNSEQRQEEFLKSLTIVPKEPKDDDQNRDKYHEIIFNLDTEKQEIEIKLGKELSQANRNDFFGFELPAPKNSKLYFTTNNFYYHLFLIHDLISYIKSKNIEVKKEFKEFFENLKIFYSIDSSKNIFNYNKIKNDQKNILLNYSKESINYFKAEYFKVILDSNLSTENKNLLESAFCFENNKYKLDDKIELDNFYKLIKIFNNYDDKKYDDIYNIQRKALEKYIYCNLLNVNSKIWKDLKLNIFSLKINNKYFHEMDEYKSDYFKIVFYSLKDRFFDKKIDSHCSLCGTKEKKLTGNIDIPTKFYITDKPTFFENTEQKNSYKSFTICEECYEEIRVGINYVDEYFNARLFNLNYYLIPKKINNLENDTKLIRKLLLEMSKKKESKEDHITHIEEIKRLEEKNKNLIFDFLFWFVPEGQAAAFVVLENITDISYHRIKEINDHLEKINNNSLYNEMQFKPGWNDIYYYLFPNYKSHPKVDNKIYRKEMVSFFSSIVKGRTINYQDLINRFNNIFKKTFLKKETTDIDKDFILNYRPTKMNILLSWLAGITQIEGGFMNQEGQKLIEIENEDIIEYFKIHSDIYEKSPYRQGLFLLGMLINSIKKEQRDKKSTILNKINFDGIPVRRLKKFIIDITEMLKIYDLFEAENKIYAQMMDRMQGIENSSLSKDEVVFYILSGISFGRYLGSKYASQINKKEEEKGDPHE